MIYSDELKVCWFTPQRNGTRSTHALLSALNFQSLGTHAFVLPPERKDYFLISNVRNPYSRMVSLFSLYSVHKNFFEIDFKKWVPYALADENFDFSYQLRYERKILKVNRNFDKFIKVENIKDDLLTLDFIDLSQSNLKEVWDNNIEINSYSLEFNQVRTEEKKTWQDFYDEETSSLVYNTLKDQFDLFNYKKNSWKDGTS